MAENKTPLSTNNMLVVLLIAAAFGVGYLWNRVQTLEKGGTNTLGTNTQVAQDTTQPAQPTTPETMDVVKPDVNKDHWNGPKNAKIVMVEYGDFECPYCKQFHPTPKKILEEYKDVAHVMRNFPLSFHPKAQDSAEAVECAADQGGNTAYFKF